MKKSRFTDEQIAFALKQAETGTRTDEICRKMGISDATFYKWRQKYGGLGPSEHRKLKQTMPQFSRQILLSKSEWEKCKCKNPNTQLYIDLRPAMLKVVVELV